MPNAKRTSKKKSPQASSARKSKSKEPAKTAENAPKKPFPIVEMGASADGLEAMQHLLEHLPAQTGTAYVVIQHLDPTHESALTTILARATFLARGQMLRPRFAGLDMTSA